MAGFWCERQQQMHFFTGGRVIMDYRLIFFDGFVSAFVFSRCSLMDWSGVDYCDVLSAVWTLILTAPIHCRASIAETLMQRHISTNLMKKQTHPNLRRWAHFHLGVNYSFIPPCLSSYFIVAMNVEYIWYIVFITLNLLKGQFTQKWKLCHHLLSLK